MMPTMSEMFSGAQWAAAIIGNLLTAKGKFYRINTSAAWDKEKKEIIGRALWLCEHVITEPRKLIESMPQMLGRHFMGEWAIYSSSHLAAALANIARIYPEERKWCLERIAEIVRIVDTPELRWYDTSSWGGEDAMASLAGNNSHMTYLSILAWTITNYRFAGGDSRFDDSLHACCEALYRRMLREDDLCLESFPKSPIFVPDMMFAIVALKNYSTLYGGRYADAVERWLEKAKTEFIDTKTGLLRSYLRTGGRKGSKISGAYTALNCYCLTMVDEGFARQQYDIMKRIMRKEMRLLGAPVVGIRENLTEDRRKIYFDVDAGPVAYGFSPSGTAWAIASATYFGDWQFRNEMLRTAELAGGTTGLGKKKHYRLGELAIVGEAVVLAARTNTR